MPEYPLPDELVARLQRHPRLIDRALGKMKNIDPRNDGARFSPEDTSHAGMRVRELGVVPGFPGIRVVIKREHGRQHEPTGSAERTLEAVLDMVRAHNRLAPSDKFEVRAPHAYAIGKDLLVMSKTDKPTVLEILGAEDGKPSKRGRLFFEGLRREHGVTEAQLNAAFEAMSTRVKWGANARPPSKGNLLLLGVEKRKFIFMPQPDLF